MDNYDKIPHNRKFNTNLVFFGFSQRRVPVLWSKEFHSCEKMKLNIRKWQQQTGYSCRKYTFSYSGCSLCIA